jgi:hypothetical protein
MASVQVGLSVSRFMLLCLLSLHRRLCVWSYEQELEGCTFVLFGCAAFGLMGGGFSVQIGVELLR